MAGTRHDVRYSDQTEMGSQVLTWAFARKVQKAHAPAGAKDVDGDGWVWINLTDSTPAGGTAESFEEGEVFTHQGWRFEIVDMDGRKIDKLLVQQNDSPGSVATADLAQ